MNSLINTYFLLLTYEYLTRMFVLHLLAEFHVCSTSPYAFVLHLRTKFSRFCAKSAIQISHISANLRTKFHVFVLHLRTKFSRICAKSPNQISRICATSAYQISRIYSTSIKFHVFVLHLHTKFHVFMLHLHTKFHVFILYLCTKVTYLASVVHYTLSS